ncbi:hypothetical protein SAMN05192533_104237 [Mesobacillus persicus]|uniref:Capsular polysaccharide biosynthesis protein n=1 Tax=Mesobacillus persicus TaxID=930146 RepID=A0A1H8A400_9BACI|nr:hypothetical protein [Mesobacillus persicus]SEM65420.1 hypothetical protein SAMN05192533_104237 [Mesobacillus persicus]
MKEFINRIVGRAKKLVWLLILIPVFTAGIAFIFANKAPSSYQGYSQIILGNFENEYMTNGTFLKDFYTSEGGLESINQKYNLNIDINEVKSSFSIIPSSSKPVELTYSGSSREEVEETLTKLTDAILEETTIKYQTKVNGVEERINSIEEIETDTEPVTKHYFLYNLSTDETNLRNSELIQEVKVSEITTIPPQQRAVLGLLIGLILSVFIVVVPELFREEEKAAK